MASISSIHSKNNRWARRGASKNAERFLREPFLVISGDALTDFDLTKIIEFHQSHGATATITLTRVPNPLDYGVVVVDERGYVRQFLEKPSWGEVFSDTVNTGIYVVTPEIFRYIEKGAFYRLVERCLSAHAAKREPAGRICCRRILD